MSQAGHPKLLKPWFHNDLAVFENMDNTNFPLQSITDNFFTLKHCWDEQHRKSYKEARSNNMQ